ncbi:MAG: adenine phosphoribosyltransferase [Bacteroidales bacterium]|jgi:adenine phosphoribosyltransferase|nr:adenine phosphoribosyltransferase [Bacteroidales bacterium]
MIDINKVRIVPNFPSEGIQFYDITTILNDAEEYQRVFNVLLEEAKKSNPGVIVALESRGYYFGPAIALALKIPFVPIRKKGKLPFATYSESYDLEYGQATIEIHTDALKLNKNVLLFDDILATGGTAAAAVKLINHFEPNKVSALFFMELAALHGREKLKGLDVASLLTV